MNRKISNRLVKMSAPAMPVKPEDGVKMNGSVVSDLGRIRLQYDQNKPHAVDRLPLVTKLLRACRDSNEILIKAALREVILCGATREEINLADKSGRVSHVILLK